MRHRISWSDLAGVDVGVWGAGVEGQAAVRKLEAVGARLVVIADDHPGPPVGGRPVIRPAAGGMDALGRCQVVIKSPGVSRYQPQVGALEAQGVAVVGGLGLWLQGADRERVVCVTGTKGKSTTVSIAGHLLRGLGYRAFVGGNLGLPPFDPDAPTDVDFWVVEVSSYQAAEVPASPPTVGVTSLHPDHLTWHGDVDTYYRDKLSLCSQPGARLTVANGEDDVIRQWSDHLGPEVVWVTVPPAIPEWVGRLGLLGRHNQVNALIAQACLKGLGVPADDAQLVDAAGGFEQLPSRLRPIGTVDGVTFVDDSLSTNVLPTTAALSVFGGRRVALLVGGHDRGIDYTPLVTRLAERVEPTVVLGLPATGHDVVRALRQLKGSDARACDDLDEAVAAAFEWARPDGVVLLSPAAASFGQFRNYEERSEAFVAAMEGCRQSSAGG